MIDLLQKVRFIKGVGPKVADRLKKIGIIIISDLIFYFPRAWLDLSKLNPISNLRVGQEVVIKAKISDIINSYTPRQRMIITRAILSDSHGQISAIWFSQPYLLQNLKKQSQWIFSGKVSYDWQQKKMVLASPIYEKDGRILPIYPETKGVTSKYLRKIIYQSTKSVTIRDFLPVDIIQEEKLLSLDNAIKQVHFPDSMKLLNQAKNRLAFDELFLIALKIQIVRLQMVQIKTFSIPTDKITLQKFTKSLPYVLTGAQRKAAWEIINDLSKNKPMNRLLEGDVGSGKTIVALMAVLNTINAGYQVAWMVPTEILANQHYNTAKKLLAGFNTKITLLTSKNRKITHSITQDPDLIIGTQALIQKGVKFSQLGLVIIDEQHRFGVEQRAKLTKNFKKIPHFLSMTATPIPRTLALSLYGDLDISILNEMPPGRKTVITKLVDPTNREKAYDFIKSHIKANRQVYVICPLIEISNKQLSTNNLFNLEKKSVKKEYEKLSKDIFPEYKIVMMHGKLRSKEKEKIMSEFKLGKIDILVSTSVIEVGIDVPNAVIMMIEDADRFGLAQLHQFRGRVGRGEKQSFCLLFTNSLSPDTNRRLKALVECNDGFKLSQKDLEIRGPGQLAGLSQSGLPDLKMAKLSDIILIEKTRRWAKIITAKGVEKFPLLANKLNEYITTGHLE